MTDKQRHPRIPTRLPVDVTTGLGEENRAWICNLSPGGVMIDGNEDLKNGVCGDQCGAPLHRPIEVRIRCQLPGESIPLAARCRLVYVRRLSQHKFNLGFRFVELDGVQAHQLSRYVQRQLTGDAPPPLSPGKTG